MGCRAPNDRNSHTAKLASTKRLNAKRIFRVQKLSGLEGDVEDASKRGNERTREIPRDKDPQIQRKRKREKYRARKIHTLTLAQTSSSSEKASGSGTHTAVDSFQPSIKCRSQ